MNDDAFRDIADIIENAEVVGETIVAESPEKSPPSRSRGEDVELPLEGGSGRKATPQDWGYDLDALNEEWALVLMGSKAVIVHEQPNAPVEDRVTIRTIEAFKAWLSNTFTQIEGSDGKIKTVSYAQRWLTERKRRQFRGVEFFPSATNEKGSPDYLNLWRGFSVSPKKDAGSYAIFRDHILNNVCAGREDYFNWVFAWFAHIVQRPRERIGTAIVFRGKMGTGKTKIGEVFGSLIAAHYFLVDEPRYVTGQFNAHMASCLLLQAEEAVWAGDKAAEGRLKGLVTSKKQMIEAKGVDPIRLDNYVRLIMTSNEDWVVPAGKDERRFCVLDVDDRCAQNHEYFKEMDEELDNGGREVLLHDLLHFDLESVNIRQIPRTSALLEQKLRSLDHVESWWFERLMSGTSTRSGNEWLSDAPIDKLFEDYLFVSEQIGVRRKAELIAFGIKLRKLLPELKRHRPTIEVETGVFRRVWCYALPPLEECRDFFQKEVGQNVSWEGMAT